MKSFYKNLNDLKEYIYMNYFRIKFSCTYRIMSCKIDNTFIIIILNILFILFIQISSVRKCTNSNTVYEAIRDYETAFHNTEFNNSNSIDISNNEQIDTIKIGFTENACLTNSHKEIFPSVFKTASEIINEERLRVFTLDKNKKAQSKELPVNNAAQKSTHENDKSHMKISSGFICAREIHESNVIKSSKSSSKPKVRRSKADKNVKKTVYEQILAQSSSKKITNERKITDERRDISFEAELKMDNIIDSIKIENENKDKSKNKRSHESSECHEYDIESAKKKKIIHNEYIDKINSKISDKKILSDKIETKITGKSTDTIININVVSDDTSRTTKNTEKHLEIKANVELKKKEETVHMSHSKHHKHSSSNKLKVPADKATQFKTAEILKSYLMKYYPSKRLPDRATFSKICREMHYNMLKKKIFGMIT